MDLEQFGKIFDELDKDRIKEVALPPRQLIHFLTHFNLDVFDLTVSLCLPCPAPSPTTVQLSSSSKTPANLQSLFFHHTWQCCGTGQRHVHLCRLDARTHADIRTLVWTQDLNVHLSVTFVFQTVLVLNSEKTTAERDNFIMEVNIPKKRNSLLSC